MFECISLRREELVGIITLNRPRVLNAINTQMMREFSQALDQLVADDSVRAIVIHGEGRAFSAGFDLKEFAEHPPTTSSECRNSLEGDLAFLLRCWDCRKPTIAAVHGYCLAGAFELMISCDLSVAAVGTRFGEPEVRFGAGIVAMLLPWMTTPKVAKELLLTGKESLSTDRAVELGIVNYVVPAGEELEKAIGLARDIAAASPLSVQLTKQAINRSYDIAGMRQALLAALETDIIITTSSPERAEFNRIAQTSGLATAIAWRDARQK